MRGIVELEILRSIERALNDKLAIQYFFDLIVGTRYVNKLANEQMTNPNHTAPGESSLWALLLATGLSKHA